MIVLCEETDRSIEVDILWMKSDSDNIRLCDNSRTLVRYSLHL
jgi:hypothetical protein